MLVDKLNVLGSPAIALLISIALLYFLYQKFTLYQKLRHFGGPFLTHFSHFWIFNQTVAGKFHSSTTDVLRKYGGPESIARIAPNTLITGNSELWKMISDDRAWEKGAFYSAMQFEPGKDHVFSETDTVRHDVLKEKLSRGYSGKDNLHLESQIETIIKNLFQYIDANPTFDLAAICQFFTLDTLSQIAFGQSFGCLPSGTDVHDYVPAMRDFMVVAELKFNVPWVDSVTKSAVMQKIFAPTPKDKKGMGKVMGIAHQIVADRYSHLEKSLPPDGNRDMLASFIEKGLTQAEAENESLLQIIAGADSTSSFLTTALFYSLTSPRVWSNLRAEFLSATTSTPSPFLPHSTLSHLPYLQSVLKEALRMYPPLTGSCLKIAPAGGAVVPNSRIFIPAGTQVGICVWALRNDTAAFGEDAGVFRPERWLEADVEGGEGGARERLRKMDLALGTVFGLGRHRCLGRGIAMVEVGKVVAEIVRAYDLSIVDPVAPFTTRCNGTHLMTGMNVVAVRTGV